MLNEILFGLTVVLAVMVICAVTRMIIYNLKRPCGCWNWCSNPAHNAINVSVNMSTGVPTGMSERMVNNTRVVTLYYTNWCHYCKLMKPVWAQVKLNLAPNGIVFAENDEEKNRTEGITGYPTILMVDEYGKKYKYEGGANAALLTSWILSPNHLQAA